MSALRRECGGCTSTFYHYRGGCTTTNTTSTSYHYSGGCTTSISAGSAPCLQAAAPPHPNIHPPQLSALIPRLLYLCNQIYKPQTFFCQKFLKRLSEFPLLNFDSRQSGSHIWRRGGCCHPATASLQVEPLQHQTSAIPLHACLCLPIIPVTVRTAGL